MKLHEAIKKGLNKKHLMQKDLAVFCNKSNSAVSDWISGKGNPSAQDLIKIANYLDIVSDIFPDYAKFDSLSVPEESKVENTEQINYIDYLNLKMDYDILKLENENYRKNYNMILDKLEKMQKGFDYMLEEIKKIKKEIGME